MISFVFSTNPKNILSRIIRRFTKSKCSHVALLTDEFLGIQCVMEATLVGVALTPLQTFLARGNVIVDVVEPEVDLREGLRATAQLLAAAYDFSGLLGMLFVYLGRALHKRWRNPWRTSTSMFCSELVTRAMQAASYPGADQLDPHSTSPEDLLEWLKRVRPQ